MNNHQRNKKARSLHWPSTNNKLTCFPHLYLLKTITLNIINSEEMFEEHFYLESQIHGPLTSFYGNTETLLNTLFHTLPMTNVALGQVTKIFLFSSKV